MKLDKWCDAEAGRITKLAEHLGVSVSAASQMVRGHIPVPPGRYRQIVDFAAGQVTFDDLVPAPFSSVASMSAVEVIAESKAV